MLKLADDLKLPLDVVTTARGQACRWSSSAVNARNAVQRHYVAAGGPEQCVRNIVTHLETLLSDEQKAAINWHDTQSADLAVMRIISAWLDAGAPGYVQTHPAVAAWQVFRTAHASVFDGTADGRYLENRLERAFQEGWNAAERSVQAALGSVQTPTRR